MAPPALAESQAIVYVCMRPLDPTRPIESGNFTIRRSDCAGALIEPRAREDLGRHERRWFTDMGSETQSMACSEVADSYRTMVDIDFDHRFGPKVK